MGTSKYVMSFTTGGLFFTESIRVARIYQLKQDWEKAKQKIIDDNILQYNSIKTTKRILREIKIRLVTLNDTLLSILINGERKEQLLILWIAICKAYKFIGELASEVIRENFLLLNQNFTNEDYMAFFNSKADWHEELDSLSEKTIQKQKQVVFRILREAEIVSPNQIILPVLPSKELLIAIAKDNPNDLMFLPISELDIKEILNNA